MLELISNLTIPPEITKVLKDAAGPMLGRAAGTVAGQKFGMYLKDQKEIKLAEQACQWALQEWLLALIKTFHERSEDDEYIQQFFGGYAQSIEHFLGDETAAEELLKPFTGSVSNPTLNSRLLVERWHILNLPKLPADFDAARACRWYVEALNTKRQALKELRDHWTSQAAERRNRLLEDLRGPWAEWDLDQYAKAMQQRYQALDITTLELIESQDLESQPIKLKDLFIAQDARRSRPRRTLPRDYLEQQRELRLGNHEKKTTDSIEKMLGDDAELDTLWTEARREPIFDILTSDDVHHLVVLGDPGAGKSCLVRHIALSVLEVFNDDTSSATQIRPWLEKLSGHLPLLIELRKFATWEEKGGLHGFIGYLHYLGCEHGFALNMDDLSRKFEDETSLIMFDGLDEIINSKERNSLAERIAGIARRYPKTKVIG